MLENKDFIAELPHHSKNNLIAAEKFGAPYLPDEKSIVAVENFWNKNERKKKYLSHLRRNSFIADFIDGVIDAKTCIGMLRSIATEYGFVSIYNVAKMVRETITDKVPPNNSFCVEPKNLLCGDEQLGDIKKPESLHPRSSLTNSEIFRKMNDPLTKGVSLDWSETAEKIDSASCRIVAALTNLICAIIIPAYTLSEVVALNGEAEHAVLHQHAAAATDVSANTKDAVDEMCVLVCIHSLIQYFSSKHHLFSAPLRLPPFEKHPVINLTGSKVFSPNGRMERVVATLSVPAHTTLILNNREERRGKKIVCEVPGGITAHILSPKRQPKKKTGNETNARRDPFIHMSNKDRPLLMRNILILSGNYGWFGLILGHTPSPDILFAENNYDGLFPQNTIRKYRNKAIGPTPSRNRHLDLRFGEVEITETMGYTSCFRIRPVSLDDSSSSNVVKGTKNPFVTRMGYPKWYDSEALSAVFGTVDLKVHVTVLDHTMDKFTHLIDGDQRWKVNQEEKVTVLKNCIDLLFDRRAYLSKRIKEEFGKVANETGVMSVKRRQICNDIETAIITAVHHGQKNRGILKEEKTFQDFENAFKHASDAISMCNTLIDECQKNPERFSEGECRIAAHDLYKHIQKNSARQYIQSYLIRGVKMSVLWRRPYDECADKALACVPRCRIPQLIVGVENIEKGGKESFLPGLQILNTRDINPKPMRHILLSILFGKELAKDISAVNCLEWMNWCAETIERQKIKDEDFRTKRHYQTYSKKRKREEEEEEEKTFISGIIYDKSMPAYDILFPSTSKDDKKKEDAPPNTFVWPPRKRTVYYTDKKMMMSSSKKKTGRLGCRDIYMVASTSLPRETTSVVIKVANSLFIPFK